jgi:hypothetical protein
MRLNRRSSRVTGAAWLRLYPRAWRERYEPEMLAVLEARPPDWRARLDLARGAWDAHAAPMTPPQIPLIAALVAGVAWIVAGLASATQPLAPDWPGYLAETLPIGLLGAVAAFRVVVALGRRSGVAAPRGSAAALAIAIAGYALWITVLAIAAVGGPYGAITGAGQSVAGVGTIAVGLVRVRSGDRPFAEALLVAGAAMLVPSPAAWPVAGAAWLGLAIAAIRPSVPLRRA